MTIDTLAHILQAESNSNEVELDENEFRIEKLGADKKTQRNVNEQRRIAKIFMNGILTDQEIRMTQPTRDRLGVVKYQYVYKNFLREIKIYFVAKFQDYKQYFDEQYIRRAGFRQN